MAGLFGLLRRAKPQPSAIHSDKVVPVRFFDDNATLRGIVMAWMFRFDDVLDLEMLEAAVSELLNIPSWRHLGGRLRLNSNGKLEIHVPEHFTPDRPSVRFSRTVHDMSIHEHPLASKLPAAIPSLQPGPLMFKEFGARADAPSSLEDFLYSDEPQIAMHFTTFPDATLVSLSFTHTLSDALGIASLMSAISLVLAGRKTEVPDLPDNDILEDKGLADVCDAEPYVLTDKRVTGFAGILFGLNYAKDMLFRPTVETRTGYIPASAIKKLRTAAKADMVTMSNSGGLTPPFLSDGDILTAWGCQAILHSEPRPVPAIILNVLNVRNRFPSTTGGAFVQNLTFNSNTLLSAAEAESSTIGSIAARVRGSLIEQTTQPQLEAIIRDSRAAYTSTGNPPLYGTSDSKLLIVTNWDKAKLFEVVDFRPAVIVGSDRGKRGDLDRVVPTGRLVYHHAHSLKEAQPVRRFWNIVGKDLEGGCWYSGSLFPETWTMIEKAIEAF